MNIKKLKKTESRVDVGYLSSLNLKKYGESNLYPQEVRNIVLASVNGRNCYERRATYIEGNGLRSATISELVINRAGDKMDDLHSLLSADVAMFDGVAIHINYDVLGRIVSVSHIPFENCRLEEADEEGNIANVVVHPDWSGSLTRNGKAVKVDAKSVDVFPIFNPDPAVVQSQIAKAGGIEFYKGQVLYRTRAGRFAYSIPIFDAALTDMSTDEGLSNVGNRNVRNNFLAGGLLWVKRGTSGDLADDDFVQSLNKLQGDLNATKIMVCVGENDEEKPELIPFSGTNYDKDFTATAETTVANIYAAFNQEMFYRLRSGSIGFSGQIAGEVKAEYCEQVTKQQRMLSRIYATLFSHWREDMLPAWSKDDLRVEPLMASVQNEQQL